MERFIYVAQELKKWAPLPLKIHEGNNININDREYNSHVFGDKTKRYCIEQLKY